MKVLSPPAHGVLDFFLAFVLGMAPIALGFTGVYAVVCYGLAAAYLLVVLVTDFPMGVVRLLPYRVHGGMEVVSALLFMGSPFLFGFSASNPTARTFFIVFGGLLLLLWLLTDWSGKVHSEMPADEATRNLEGNQV